MNTLGASFGHGELREDRSEAGLWRGRVNVAGYPYELRAISRADARGIWFELQFYNLPAPKAAS